MAIRAYKSIRKGGVYIAVLGTSLIVSLLALSALMGQRIQNKIIVTTADIRQAQLNASAAVELALLTMKQTSNWRTAQPHGRWFTDRETGAGAGTCSVEVVDPFDSSLSNNADDPVIVRGIGNRGQAEQRFEIYVDARRQPADVLRAAAAAGGIVSGQSSIDWTSIFNAYTTSGTVINYNSLPTADQFEFARNVSFNTNLDHWDNDPPGLPAATFAGPMAFPFTGGRAACLRVDRSDKRAGAGNKLQVGLLKPSTYYRVSIEVHPDLAAFQSNRFKVFMLTEYSNGTYVESPGSTTAISWLDNTWTTLTATTRTPAWTQEPANVYLVVNSDHTSGTNGRFYLDNIHVCEDVSGRLLYGQALGPTASNPNGIYRINCGGGKLSIERSRILGTLVVLNPGTGSGVSDGPILMAPATPGYPSLLVNGNFSIRSTYRALIESESSVNFNPTDMPFDFNTTLASPTDGNANDIYSSEIQGLVAVSGDLQFANQPRLRGLVVAGGTVTGTYFLTSDPDSLLNPPPPLGGFYSYRYDRRPASVRKVVLP